MPFDCSVQELVFSRFHKNLMNQIRSTNGDSSHEADYRSHRIRPKDEALKFKQVQFNGTKFIYYLIFDVDHQLAGIQWMEANLPQPTMIIENPANGHCHYAYELRFPIPRDNARLMLWSDRVYKAMRKALMGADPSYGGGSPTAKNPLHPAWRTIVHDKTYTLDELSVHLDLEPISYTSQSLGKSTTHFADQDQPESRNWMLFHRLRFWTYDNVRFYPTCESFRIAVATMADEFAEDFASTPKGRLSKSEIRGRVNSVTGYVWKHYLKGRYQTGWVPHHKPPVLNLPGDMPLRQREQIGQQYTCMQRLIKTRDKILNAVRDLTTTGQRVTKAAVARLADLGVRTVHRHWPAVMNNVTVGTECPSDTSHLSGSAAVGLYTTPNGRVFDGTETETERVIRDRNDEPWQNPFISWNEPIDDHGDLMKEPPKPRYDRHNPPPAIAEFIPATGITTSMDLLSYRQLVDVGKMSVKAFLYADFMAVAYGILIPDLPANTKARLIRLINAQEHSYERYR